MITVAGRPLDSLDDLSAPVRQLISLVPLAGDWLERELAEPAWTYSFTSEETLVAGTHHGLHHSRLLLLPRLGLLAAPERLLALDADDLDVLVEVEAREKEPTKTLLTKAKKRLTANDLLTAEDLATGLEWLGELNIAEAPLFQALGLGERIRLVQLARDDSEDVDGNLRREAARFAIDRAATVAELDDLYRFHSFVAQRLGSETNAAERLAVASRWLEGLEPSIGDLLHSPSMPGEDPAPERIGEVVREWARGGTMLGFDRVTKAQLEVLTSAPQGDLGSLEPAEVAEDFQRHALAILGGNEETAAGAIHQDGASRRYVLGAPEGDHAVVIHRREGHVALDRVSTKG